MEKLFESAIFTRKMLIQVMNELTQEQLVKIPEPHRNSIFWNIAHLLVTQQLLTYGLAGLELYIDRDFADRYTKGTLALPNIEKEDLDYVRAHLIKAVEKTQEDYNRGLFTSYRNYMTSAEIELRTIEDGLQFSSYHDGIHLGVVMSLKKLV